MTLGAEHDATQASAERGKRARVIGRRRRVGSWVAFVIAGVMAVVMGVSAFRTYGYEGSWVYVDIAQGSAVIGWGVDRTDASGAFFVHGDRPFPSLRWTQSAWYQIRPHGDVTNLFVVAFNGPTRFVPERVLSVSLWVCVLIPLCAGLLLRVWIRRGEMSVRMGRCGACGYDLRGLPADAVCPECGGLRNGDLQEAPVKT